MAPKKTRKLVHETIMEEPIEDLDVPSKAIRERNKRILKNKMTVTTTMIMKMKRSHQPQSFSL
jgi:hypothetical protein